VGERSAIVVGGGIGGLATAVALVGRGWRVRVLERAEAFSEVGAGISLWPNALRALDAIGIGAAVRRLGGQELNGGIRHWSGRWLAHTDSQDIMRRFGAVTILHRADLLRALVEALPSSSLVSGVTVSSVSSTVDAAVVTYGGSTVPADLVVGADGVRSVTRHYVSPSSPGPRYAGYTAWRFITKDTVPLHGEAGETWGAGMRFGYAGLPDGRVYCYATANVPDGSTSRDGLGELASRFSDWHQPIPSLLAAAPADVLRHDIYDLPDLPSFVSGRVALLGDAAHAMTPNLGQGACQALEDAATIASLLDRHDVATALVQYDAARRRRTQTVARISRRIGDIGQWSAPMAVVVRDRLLPLIPASVTTRSLASVLEWSLPD
jgi:2-polyprenyl-6-methoxyphenol hydroxylase-like FAD-dependent oxidoreductase